MRTAELQDRLRWLGFDPGPTDGLYGEHTEEAIFDCLDRYTPPPPPPTTHVVPPAWMPVCTMERVICHWTAGAHKANASYDIPAYHILIEGDGHLVRGSYSIKDNIDTSDGRYAAHTKNCNGGSIGVSLCCMAGSVENPFDPGPYPMLEQQWTMLLAVVADLCKTYAIPVTPETVLSHAEVQGTLGITQSGKWDYTQLAFDGSVKGARACGDKLRNDVTARMAEDIDMTLAIASATPSPVVIP